MKIHILGIAGTFMGGVAALARELGHQVEGSDQAVYPPMSTQLEKLGITLSQGYQAAHISPDCDEIIIGNALSRGNPAVEAVLNAGRRYTSGAQWLAENVLPGRCTIAVAGTHGKTTTTTLVAFLLEAAGRAPGFLIGGVAEDFGVSARAGQGREFVVEADEYDTAFFDKRSKFVHYRPQVAILNNLEYDHADIFPDLAAIETQFHHLVRTVPGSGRIIWPADSAALQRVLARGCWSGTELLGNAGGQATGDPAAAAGANAAPVTRGEPAAADTSTTARAPVAVAALHGEQPSSVDAPRWHAVDVKEEADATVFTLKRGDVVMGEVRLPLAGAHNRANAIAAIVAAEHAGVRPADAIAALARFQGVKRRLEVRGTVRGVTVIDDFAHHPTAIATTIAGLRARMGAARAGGPASGAAASGPVSNVVGAAGGDAAPAGATSGGRLLAVLEPRSNTMRAGAMKDLLAASLAGADRVFCHVGGVDWDAAAALAPLGDKVQVLRDMDALEAAILAEARAGDQILVMSNGGFGGIHSRLLAGLAGAA